MGEFSIAIIQEIGPESHNLIFKRTQKVHFEFGSCVSFLEHPMSIKEGLTARQYLDIFEEVIQELMGNLHSTFQNAAYFQQDGAPSHNSAILRAFLDDNFPQRWIGTYRPVRCLPSVSGFFNFGIFLMEFHIK